MIRKREKKALLRRTQIGHESRRREEAEQVASANVGASHRHGTSLTFGNQMATKRHIGLVVFSICFALSARMAVFEPKPHQLTEAEERWGVTQRDTDPLGFIRGLRYYIYGVGLLGLGIFVQEYLAERLSKKKPNQPPEPMPLKRPGSS